MVIGCACANQAPGRSAADASSGRDAYVGHGDAMFDVQVVDAHALDTRLVDSTSEDARVIDASASQWNRANLTNFTSYPDPNSEECVRYNGCMWAGQFAAIDGVQSESWVMSHNIVAVHSRDLARYRLKTLRLRQGVNSIDVTVYDECADSDCSGCCTQNARQNGLDFLIDIESYTMNRFGSGDGVVEWMCLDC